MKTEGKSDDEKKKLLARAEDLVKQLRGGADFAEVAKYREMESSAYALKRDLQYARSKAEEAWLSKNYAVVVYSYKPFDALLTPSERKRLSIAEKRIGNGHQGTGEAT